MTRIVVLTNGNYYARLILERLFAERGSSIAGIVLVGGDYAGRSGFRGFWPIARSTAFPYLFAKVLQMLLFRVAKLCWPRVLLSVRQLAARHGAPTLDVVSIRDGSVADALASWAPDLLVSVSCPQLIPARMYRQCRFGGINIHSSLLPVLAGLAPYFWALAEGLKLTGTTVHYLTPKFDDGNVLVTREVEILSGDSAFKLFERLARAGSDAIAEAVEKAERGDPGRPQGREGGSYRSHPSILAWRQLRSNGHVVARVSELWSVILAEVHRNDRTETTARQSQG